MSPKVLNVDCRTYVHVLQRVLQSWVDAFTICSLLYDNFVRCTLSCQQMLPALFLQDICTQRPVQKVLLQYLLMMPSSSGNMLTLLSHLTLISSLNNGNLCCCCQVKWSEIVYSLYLFIYLFLFYFYFIYCLLNYLLIAFTIISL